MFVCSRCHTISKASFSLPGYLWLSFHLDLSSKQTIFTSRACCKDGVKTLLFSIIFTYHRLSQNISVVWHITQGLYQIFSGWHSHCVQTSHTLTYSALYSSLAGPSWCWMYLTSLNEPTNSPYLPLHTEHENDFDREMITTNICMSTFR